MADLDAPTNLKSIQDGALCNLKCALDGLSRAGISKYIIIGGWCPYLNRGNSYHPGTIDVDILFKEAVKPYYLRTFIETMRSMDYFTSAKHLFQLLRVFDIAGQRLCFNIDLLHTGTADQSDELFVEQLDLNIRLTAAEEASIKQLSIVQLDSKVLFDEKLFDVLLVDQGLRANVVSFTGMFLTKLASCLKVKRDRDSYDIYLGFTEGKIDFGKLSHVLKTHESIRKQYERFVSFLGDPVSSQTFNARVAKFSTASTDPSSEVLSFLSNGVHL